MLQHSCNYQQVAGTFCFHSRKGPISLIESGKMATKSWEERVADKKSRLEKTIPPEWRIKTPPTGDSFMSYPKESGILSNGELAITESNATDLVRKLADGELTSVAVTTAFCKRAALAQQLVRIAIFNKLP